MSKTLSVLAILVSVALPAAAVPMGGGSFQPVCPDCVLSDGSLCWANYGTGCTAAPGVSQCTSSQAYYNCAGWAAATGLGPDGLPTSSPAPAVPNCTLCHAGTTLCWANYGAECTAPEGVSQCTTLQAYTYCSGWPQATGWGPDGPMTPSQNP